LFLQPGPIPALDQLEPKLTYQANLNFKNIKKLFTIIPINNYVSLQGAELELQERMKKIE